MGQKRIGGKNLDLLNEYINKAMKTNNLNSTESDMLQTAIRLLTEITELLDTYKKYSDDKIQKSDTSDVMPVISDCPKCRMRPMATHGKLENDTDLYSVYVSCPACGFSAPHGKDNNKRKALEKGIEIWEREVIKYSSYSS